MHPCPSPLSEDFGFRLGLCKNKQLLGNIQVIKRKNDINPLFQSYFSKNIKNNLADYKKNFIFATVNIIIHLNFNAYGSRKI